MDAYYAGLAEIRDAVTNSEVTTDTLLTNLKVFSRRQDPALRNRMFPTKPGIAMKWSRDLEEGRKAYFPNFNVAKDGIRVANGLNFIFRMNKIDMAPCFWMEAR